jgi:hypothetical protein
MIVMQPLRPLLPPGVVIELFRLLPPGVVCSQRKNLPLGVTPLTFLFFFGGFYA